MKNTAFYILFHLLLVMSGSICAQTFSGRVVDDNGNAVPHASIYIEELQQGSITAEDGSFHIKTGTGEYNCTFQCVGYTTINTKILVPHSGLTKNITMPIKTYSIGEVIVTKSREDPAYRIMRQVIGMAPYYSNQVQEYRADVYIKGSMKIEKISRLIKAMGGKDFRKGLNLIGNNAILLESINEIYFKAPNTFRHKVISSNSSIPIDNFKGLNTMDFVNVNLYQLNFVKTDAFRNYKFVYDGSSENNGLTIYKIRIVPRIKNPVFFSGYVYIIDGSWHIYSVDIAGDAKFGTYRIKGNCYQIRPDVYLPAAMNLEGTIDFMGNKLDMTYQLSLKYKEVVLNKKTTNPIKNMAQAANTTQITTKSTNNPTKKTTNNTKRTKIDAKSMEIHAKRIKIDTNSMEMHAKSMEVGSQSMEFHAKSMEVGSKSMEFHAKSMKIDSQSMDFYTKSMEIDSQSMDFYTKSMEIDSFSIKVDSQSMDFYSDSINEYENDVEVYTASEDSIAESVPVIADKRTAKKIRADSIKKEKRRQKINAILEKENMTDRDMSRLAKLMQEENDAQRGENYLDLTNDYKVEVDSGSKSMSAAAWDSLRPITLSDEEVKSYQRRDSIAEILAKSDTDHVDSIRMRRIGRIGGVVSMFLGETFEFNGGKTTIGGTILDKNSISFNPVDGLRYGVSAKFRHDYGNEMKLNINSSVIWAFRRKAAMFNVNSDFTYLPHRRGKAIFQTGIMNRDFNPLQNPSEMEIMQATILTHNNYSRLYERFYVVLRNEIDIANGLVLAVGLNYADKWSLENHSEFSYLYPRKKYAPNNAILNDLLTEGIPLYRTIAAEVSIIYTPEYFYRYRGKRKVMVRSKYPTFTLQYKKAVPNILGSESNYDLLRLKINQRISAGIMREFRYGVDAAIFLSNRMVDFPNYIHFRINGFPIVYPAAFDPAAYRYKYAGNSFGVAADVSYVSPMILLKYLPKFSETYCRENLKWHANYTPHAGLYNELHYTISEIFLFIETGVFVGFENEKFSVFGMTIKMKL